MAKSVCPFHITRHAILSHRRFLQCNSTPKYREILFFYGKRFVIERGAEAK
jgi:hypothetical protein